MTYLSNLQGNNRQVPELFAHRPRLLITPDHRSAETSSLTVTSRPLTVDTSNSEFESWPFRRMKGLADASSMLSAWEDIRAEDSS